MYPVIDQEEYLSKLEAYYELALGSIENGFETLGIKYLFKPIDSVLKKKDDTLRVIDLLKHAHDFL
jgi:hypothetical protein